MNGNEVFDNEYIHRAQVVIDKNPDKPYLLGFRNFITEKSYSTIWAYVNHVAYFMNKVNKDPKDLVLDDYLGHLAEIKNKSASYQVVTYTALKTFSEYLKAANINLNDYMQYKKRPKYKEGIETKKKREIGFLEHDEITQYINQVHEGIGNKTAKTKQSHWMDRDLCMIMILLNTGMRCNALWKLDIDNIDFENKKLITIDKGEKFQEYMLSDEVINVLNRWLKLRKTLILNDSEKALFISNRRTRITQLAIRNIIKKYAGNIKGKYITPHKLRATAITSVYEATGDLYVAQQFAGHSSPSITANTYIRGKKSKARQVGADIMRRLTTV